MPNHSDLPLPARNDAPVSDETTLADLTVEGILPTALTGRYVRIGANPVTRSAAAAGRSVDGMIHAVETHAGRAIGYRNCWIMTDSVARTLGTDPVPGPPAAPSDVVATNVISFGGRTLALGPGALAYEFDEHLATVGRVDLAGHGRGIGPHPQLDPVTGALHLVSYGDEPALHVVAPNSQTRINVPLPDAPDHLRDLLLSRGSFVLLGEGFVGIADRASEAAPVWRDVDLRGAIAAHDLGGEVTVLAASGSLVRWTFNGVGARPEVLDDTAQMFGTTNAEHVADPAYVWTVATGGGTEIYCHDLRTGDRTTHDFGSRRHAGELSFVPDPTRRHREDGGWLIGLVHDDARNEADLIVLDAAAVDHDPVATVRVPRRIPYGLHGTWIPSA